MVCVSIDSLAQNKGIMVVHWNCRSLNNKWEEIVYILSHSKCELAIFSESWLNETTENGMLDLDGYSFLRQDRGTGTGKKRGGGLLVYYRDNIKLTHIQDFCYNCVDYEIITARLHLENTKEIYFICTYRQPAGNIQEFINIVEHIITM